MIRIALRDPAGKEVDHRTASDGQQAVQEAMMLLVTRDTLTPGDTLVVEAAELPPA